MTPSRDPVLHLLVGPNGSGKTTLVERVLQPATHLPFVNADVIARERWPHAAAEHSYEAARIAADEREALIAQRSSFIAETVFSHPSKVELLRQARQADYLITLHVLVVPVELSVARVRDRVSKGGHQVPEDKIRGRFARVWTHVGDALPLVDEALVYDNSSAGTPFRLIARYAEGRPVSPPDWPAWTPETLRATAPAVRRAKRSPRAYSGGQAAKA